MILSHRWLERHLGEIADPELVRRGLEQLGIEVARVGSYGENFNTIELVEVLERRDLKETDHLHLIDVRRGDGSVIQIVTGASNGFPADHLWYAPPGTTLPDGRTLETKALRGILSPGMLLSAEELGYQASGGDLWIWNEPTALGTRFLEAIGGIDTVYDVELTPNLAQYLQSHYHIAQELGAIWDRPLQSRPTSFTYQEAPLALVADVDRCPLYGLVEFSIKPNQVSPLWMQSLLLAIGQRIIHPAVDVTNYAMWDLGLPLHAFDRGRVDGEILVRHAQEGEHLTLLDGSTIALDPEDLLISDKTRALALAGIMGGEASGVQQNTEHLLLECAHFSAPGIFKSYKAHHLMTDAAQHFGKGTDPAAVLEAPALVMGLFESAGILAAVGSSTLVGELPINRQITGDLPRISDILGTDIPHDTVRTALIRMGYQVLGDEVVVPLYRHDVEAIYDLAEDVGRFLGIDTIPSRLPVLPVKLAGRDPSVSFDESIRDVVASAGYDEVLTRSFTHLKADGVVALDHEEGTVVKLTNPLRDEESILRRHVLGSLLEVVKYNRARHDLPLRVFELGTVFHQIGDRVVESRELAVALSLDPPAEYPSPEVPSIYDLTGLCEVLCERFGWPVSRTNDQKLPSFLHPGRSQWIRDDDQNVGYVGELLPSVAKEFHVRRLGVMVLQLDHLPAQKLSRPRIPSRFPEVQRDLSLVVPDAVPYRRIADAIDALGIDILQDMRVVNRFEGDFGVSVTIRLTFQSHDQTLTDAEADEAISRILTALQSISVGIRQ